MKNLSLKKLKLDENDLLQREQLKSVFGGYYGGGGGDDARHPCRITTINDGVRNVSTYNATGSDPSGEANSLCVSIIQNDLADRCFYDCWYDGFGQ